MLKASRPLCVAGGRGGAAAVAADLIRARMRTNVELADAAELRGAFEGADLHNGLTDTENEKLFETSDLDLIVALIMRGLRWPRRSAARH